MKLLQEFKPGEYLYIVHPNDIHRPPIVTKEKILAVAQKNDVLEFSFDNEAYNFRALYFLTDTWLTNPHKIYACNSIETVEAVCKYINNKTVKEIKDKIDNYVYAMSEFVRTPYVLKEKENE